jgi:hypothetical protein
MHSIPSDVIGVFNWTATYGSSMVLRWIQPLPEVKTRNVIADEGRLSGAWGQLRRHLWRDYLEIWEPRRLTSISASTTCYTVNFEVFCRRGLSQQYSTWVSNTSQVKFGVFCFIMTVRNTVHVLGINLYKLSNLWTTFWNNLHYQWKSHWTVTIPGKIRCALLHYDSSKHCTSPPNKFV